MPHIAYSVNILSRHQNNPTDEEWKMVKPVCQYLKCTKSLGLGFRGKLDDLQSFSDASFADCKGSLKQSYIALSTCQAEFVAMSEACEKMVSLRNFLS